MLMSRIGYSTKRYYAVFPLATFKRVCLLSVLGCLLLSGVAPTSALAWDLKNLNPLNSVSASEPDTYSKGVEAYRDGDFKTAKSIFTTLHAKHPEQTNSTYYLAMATAQLGDYTQARRLYEEVIALNPNSEEAKLSNVGLAYLPAKAQLPLDEPPRFNTAGTTKPTVAPRVSNSMGASVEADHSDDRLNAAQMTGSSSSNTTPYENQPITPAMVRAQSQPNTVNNPNGYASNSPAQTSQQQSAYAPVQQSLNPSAQQAQGYSPQDMMMLQMMMGSGNGNNSNNNMSWMMMPGMMQQADPNNPQQPAIDPNVMSSMLMNQMLQNFNFDSKKDDE